MCVCRWLPMRLWSWGSGRLGRWGTSVRSEVGKHGGMVDHQGFRFEEECRSFNQSWHRRPAVVLKFPVPAVLPLDHTVLASFSVLRQQVEAVRRLLFGCAFVISKAGQGKAGQDKIRQGKTTSIKALYREPMSNVQSTASYERFSHRWQWRG